MENLKIYGPESDSPDSGREVLARTDAIEIEVVTEPPLWKLAWDRINRRMDLFRDWAAPPLDPELDPGDDRERGLVPVALLLAVALMAQYVQLSLPYVSDFLLPPHDLRQRLAWMGFFLLKQWALFIMMLLALALRDEKAGAIGFPKIDTVRGVIAGGLVIAALLAAVFREPLLSPLEAHLNFMTAVLPGERALTVLISGTAAVVEESLFRGFAIVLLYRWSGSLTLSVVFPALIFAAGHSYLSWGNVPFAFVAALLFSLLFLWKRNLYWPMAVHFAINSIDLFRI